MKKLTFLVLVSLLTSALFAQEIELTDAELKTKLDSVLNEGNLLYQYERAAWVATDLAMGNPEIRTEISSFLVYEDQAEMKVIFTGKQSQNCIAAYSFQNEFDKPKSTVIETRELSAKEKGLLELRGKIFQNIGDPQYEVVVPEGYDLNFVLLPFGEKYKFYILTGTSQAHTIPFGNDYLFITDKNGTIESRQKFHSRMIAAEVTEDTEKLVHSHLKTTPFITPTDICTFKLYAPFCYGIDEFSVYASGKYMKYSRKSNTISIE